MPRGTREKVRRTVRANNVGNALRRFQGGGDVDVTSSSGTRTISNNRGTMTLTRAGRNTLRFSPNGTRRIRLGSINNRQPGGGSGSNSPEGSTYRPAS